MSVSLSSKAKPAFFKGNYFNRHADEGGQLACSTGNTLRHRLYDIDGRAQWTSAGSDDTTAETVTAQLWLPSMQTERDVDLVAFLNHNLKNFNLNFLSGVTTNNIVTETVNAETNTVDTITAATGDNIILTMTTTQTANVEKLLGTLIMTELNFQTAERFLSYEPLPTRVGTKSVEMYDGSIRYAHDFRSDASFEFWAAKCSWYVDTAAELARFLALMRLGEDFLFMPFPGEHPEFIKLCRIKPGTFHDKPFHRSVPDIRVVSMVIEETGGA